RTARALAIETGQPVSEPVLHEVQQILHAVLADADMAARWEAGRLVKAPDAPMGFTGLEPAPGAVPPRRAARPAAPARGQVRPPASDAEEWAAQARGERAEAVQAEAAEARAQAAAQELADRAGADVAAAEDDVRAAGERLETARAASAGAATRLEEPGRAAVKARARAETAARKAEKLAAAGGEAPHRSFGESATPAQ
ncbi:hypothetical protein ACFXJJ_17260, partial [Streptomyces sp. NPDC059233]